MARSYDRLLLVRLEFGWKNCCGNFSTVVASVSPGNQQNSKGDEYMNFWIGCGSFRDGHNGPNMTAPLIDYIKSIAIAPATGLFRAAKCGLLKAFRRLITPLRDLTDRVPRPGANADEAVVKPADKVTRGRNLIALINGFNGATLAARAATGSF